LARLPSLGSLPMYRAKQMSKNAKVESTPLATVTPEGVNPSDVIKPKGGKKQAKPKEESEALELPLPIMGLEVLPSSLVKFGKDAESATGQVRAAYGKAGKAMSVNAFDTEIEKVFTVNQAIATAKDLVKNHGLSAKVANKWIGKVMLKQAVTFLRSIGEL
jgi:hypothetical protein